MYKRKTRDRWDIMTNYGYGWECECSEYSFKEAEATKRDYLENAQGLVGIYIEKHRERIER